jgi:hypothetical protein
MTLFLLLFGLFGVGCAYWFLVRPIIKNAPVFSELFAREASFFQKANAVLVGMRTKLAAKFFVLSGALLGLYDLALPIVMGQDWSPITSKLPAWTMPVALTVAGVIFGWLRKITENPPMVITQKTDEGVVQVVDVIKTPPPVPPAV